MQITLVKDEATSFKMCTSDLTVPHVYPSKERQCRKGIWASREIHSGPQLGHSLAPRSPLRGRAAARGRPEPSRRPAEARSRGHVSVVAPRGKTHRRQQMNNNLLLTDIYYSTNIYGSRPSTTRQQIPPYNTYVYTLTYFNPKDMYILPSSILYYTLRTTSAYLVLNIILCHTLIQILNTA